ncbi:MAG: glucokinase, partial [Gammaproteobacteria bacterium]
DASIGVIGPGTGLGVCSFVPMPAPGFALPGEGGHVTYAPQTDREHAIVERLKARYSHVSAERVVSGPGLVALYEAIVSLNAGPTTSLSPAQVTARGLGNEDCAAVEALAVFCAMLGNVSGNLALTLGARGGVYIAGGIIPKLGTTFAQSPFRASFENKGRFQRYLARIPTYVITTALLGLRGAALALRDSPVETGLRI